MTYGKGSIADVFPMSEREKMDKEHASNPKPGDYWHECYSPVCVVLAVAAGVVIYCDTPKETDNGWTWDLEGKRQAKSIQDFYKWLEYDTIPNRFWASCCPQAHMWVLNELH